MITLEDFKMCKISTVTIRPDGWSAIITIEDFAVDISNTVYDFGLNLSDDTSCADAVINATVKFTIESHTFDVTNGEPVITEYVVYGISILHKPYPDEINLKERVSGDALKVTIALSEYIFTKDKITNVKVVAGWAKGILKGKNNSITITDAENNSSVERSK